MGPDIRNAKTSKTVIAVKNLAKPFGNTQSIIVLQCRKCKALWSAWSQCFHRGRRNLQCLKQQNVKEDGRGHPQMASRLLNGACKWEQAPHQPRPFRNLHANLVVFTLCNIYATTYWNLFSWMTHFEDYTQSATCSDISVTVLVSDWVGLGHCPPRCVSRSLLYFCYQQSTLGTFLQATGALQLLLSIYLNWVSLRQA